MNSTERSTFEGWHRLDAAYCGAAPWKPKVKMIAGWR
jgi:hypothetical protein